MTGRPRDENRSKAALQKRRQRARKAAAAAAALSQEERRRQMFEEAERVFRPRPKPDQPPPLSVMTPLRIIAYTRSPTLNLGDDKP
jgi:hypothetical protein